MTNTHNKRCYKMIIGFVASYICFSFALQASERSLHIYLDADRSVNSESAISIERGVRTALDEVDSKAGGVKLVLVPLDHRGNVLRSKLNFKKAIADDTALAVITGIHSPPLLKNRQFINENRMPTLIPWAAAGPITRAPTQNNWFFRVSVDDAHAGAFIANYAAAHKACNRPAMMIESTPWGDTNLKTIGAELKNLGIDDVPVFRFGFNLKHVGAEILIAKAKKAQADCLLLVGNSREGASIVNAAVPNDTDAQALKVISHWGITAGALEKAVPHAVRQRAGLEFIQSCYSFNRPNLDEFGQAVFERAKDLFPDQITHVSDIKSPVGFIHAYDLTRILIAALDQTPPHQDIKIARNDLRQTLENLKTPVKGLVKTYEKPFSVYHPDTATNAHDALGVEHYCMASYNARNDIIVAVNHEN